MAPIFVTVATHSEHYFPTLVSSLKYANQELVVLGWGKKWKGFMMKFELIAEWLEGRDRKEVVCFLDGFDSVFFGDPDKMELDFIESGAGIIFSRPNHDVYGAFSFITRYFNCRIMGDVAFDELVNVGLYIGYAGVILDLFKIIIKKCHIEGVSDDEKCVNLNRDIFPVFDIRRDDERFFVNNPKDVSTAYAFSFPAGIRMPDTFKKQLPFEVNIIQGGVQKRYLRMPFEYFPVFKSEFVILIIVFLISITVYRHQQRQTAA